MIQDTPSETTSDSSANVGESLLARDVSEPQQGESTGDLTRSGAFSTQKLDDLKQRVATKLSTTADSVREMGGGSALDPVRTRVSALMSTAADRIQQLQTPNVDNLSVDTVRVQATDVIRRYPLQAVAAGLGLGLLFGRAMKR